MTYILLIFTLFWLLLFWRMGVVLRRESYDLGWPNSLKIIAFLRQLIDTTENESTKQEAVRLLLAFHVSFIALGLTTILQGLLFAGIVAW